MRYIILFIAAIVGFILMASNVRHITSNDALRIILLLLTVVPFVVLDYWITEKAPEKVKNTYENFSFIVFMNVFAFFFGLKAIRKKNLRLSATELKLGYDKKDLNYYFIEEDDRDGNSYKTTRYTKVFWFIYRKETNYYKTADDLVPCNNIDQRVASNKSVKKFNL